MSGAKTTTGAFDYRQVFLSTPDGVLLADATGVILEVNPATEALFRYSRAELIGRPVEDLVPEAARGRHKGHREAFVADPRPRPMGIELELTGRRRDGSLFPVEISLSPLGSGDGLTVIATVRDVTARKRLRNFGVSALKAAEFERQRIAQELHDRTAQHLAALLLRIKAAGRAEKDKPVLELLEELRGEIHGCAEGIRRIARGLRPPALEEAGLTAAVAALAEASTETGSAVVTLRADKVDEHLSADQKLAAYRIIQESVSNVIRHADAESVMIRLRRADGLITGAIEDDGRGFEVEQVSQEGDGLGIIGMYERARAVGGRVTIESEPGRGTCVRFEFAGPSR